jgi:RimJ/RimL family protein N-acetyltransferase
VNQVNRVEIHCAPEDTQSTAVPRKPGYRHEATRRQRILAADGTYGGTMIWTLLRHEYPDSQAVSYEVEAFDAAV